MTIGLSDGARLFAVRYASGPVVNSLHVSTDVASIRLLYPEAERLFQVEVARLCAQIA
jgi:glutamine amidotransferase